MILPNTTFSSLWRFNNLISIVIFHLNCSNFCLLCFYNFIFSFRLHLCHLSTTPSLWLNDLLRLFLWLQIHLINLSWFFFNILRDRRYLLNSAHILIHSFCLFLLFIPNSCLNLLNPSSMLLCLFTIFHFILFLKFIHHVFNFIHNFAPWPFTNQKELVKH